MRQALFLLLRTETMPAADVPKHLFSPTPRGAVDGGFTLAVTGNVQLDVGVIKSAPDVQPFIGLTYRY